MNFNRNPRTRAAPREWVLPSRAQHSRAGREPRRGRSGFAPPPSAGYKPGYGVMAQARTPNKPPPVLVGSNGRYYQQIPGYRVPDGGHTPRPVPVHGKHGVSPKPGVQPLISTRQQNNQTTHYMVNNGAQQGQTSLFERYPSLSPIYTMTTAPKAERAALPPVAAAVGNFQVYNAPANMPVSNIPNPSPKGYPEGDKFESNSLEREVQNYTEKSPVVSQPSNPPDIISVLSDPKSAQTPIATVSAKTADPESSVPGPILVGSPTHQFKPSGDGAFKPPPPRSQMNRTSTPTSVPQNPASRAPPSRSPATLHPNEYANAHDLSHSSLEDFANKLGGSSPAPVRGSSPRGPQSRAKPADSSRAPPIPARASKPSSQRASVVDKPIKDPTNQVH